MSQDTKSKQDISEPAPAAEGGDVQAAESGSNRRAFPRLRPGEVGGLAAARLASGAEIKLIDLSRGGAQFESDRRFLPNSTVSLRLVTHDSTFAVQGRVVRSRIVRLEAGGLGYNVAVAFNELLQHVIDDAPAEEGPATPSSTDEKTAKIAPAAGDPLTPTETENDSGVSLEEIAAFEATVPQAPAMLTVTAAVNTSGEELLDIFNGNDW